jgi:non-specific serine/threonine protein kinase
VEALVGRGGMGEVYRARQLNLRRTVAVKVLRARFLRDAAVRARFEREALAVARLRHPNIVTVHDLGVAEGVGAFIVMEYVEGRSLRQELRARGRLGEPEAVVLMRQVCAGVAAAHAAGVVHRDLKPENVLLEPTREGTTAKVVDFGIAKLEESALPGEGGLTREGVVLGTPAYMAPEQCRGEAADARSDVYALGCVLFELLTGEPPFAGPGAASLIYRHLHEAPRRPGELAGGLSRAVDEAVVRALAKAPEERYATVEALGRALGVVGVARAATIAQGGATGGAARATVTLEGAFGGEPLPPTNLPQAITRFIGRGWQIAEVRRQLAAHRLVTLTGVGGIGKTRLALEVAREAMEEFPGGVWLAELAALADPSLVAQTVAGALGVREEAGRPLAATLAAWLGDRRALLVMDNCEHLAEACATLAMALLRDCPRLRILATSREALRAAGEAVWAVAALELAVSAAYNDAVLVSEAVTLFVDRAKLSNAGFTADHRNASALAAVCRRLEGIPLAIELAAARVKVLSVEQILERLEDRFRLLTSGSRTGPSRQQTLRATLDWSYELLSDEERTLLRWLSVFAGGWSLEVAEQVCAGGGIGAGAVLDLLSRLVDKSLVTAHDRRREVRYHMLETVREYASEQLRARGEANDMARRHAEVLLALGEAGKAQIIGAAQVAWLATLETEHDNLRAALAWLLEHDGEGCLRLTVALRNFWSMQGHLREGRRWLDAVLQRSDTAPAPALADALWGAGALAQQQGDLEAAGRFYEERLRIATELGDMRRIAFSIQCLGILKVDQGDLPAARAYLEESLALGREADSHFLIAGSLNSLGEVARLEGVWAEARQLFEQAVTLARQAENEYGLRIALANLGAVACEQGDLRGASACYCEALASARASGSTADINLALDGLGAVAAKRGAWERAARLAGAAEALRDQTGAALEPNDRNYRERYLADVRAHAGREEFEAAMAVGRGMALEEAVAYALAM